MERDIVVATYYSSGATLGNYDGKEMEQFGQIYDSIDQSLSNFNLPNFNEDKH